MRENGVFKGHYHNLGTEIAKKLPEFLKAPDAIIQLANGRLNLFATVETERGNNGIISIELNSTKDIGGKYEDYNVVVTMFSSGDRYAQNLISGDEVTVKYRREDLSQVNPQLYKWLATINDKSSADISISQNDKDVNTYGMQDTKKYSKWEKATQKPYVSSRNIQGNVLTSDEHTAQNESAENQPLSMYEIMDELGLTYDEGRAILEYKSSGSYTLNENMRAGKPLSAQQTKIKDYLNSALDKFPMYEGVVYRNIGFLTQDAFDDFIAEHTKKSVVIYPAFTSASKTLDGYIIDEMPYLVHYEIESRMGRDVSKIGVEKESEIIFRPDTTFEIQSISRKENIVSIILKESAKSGKSKVERSLENGAEQQRIKNDDSEVEYTGIIKEISDTSDAFRGRSSAYDKVHSGESKRNGDGIGEGSKQQNSGSDSKTWNDSDRKGALSGIDETIDIKREKTGKKPYVIKPKKDVEQAGVKFDSATESVYVDKDGRALMSREEFAENYRKQIGRKGKKRGSSSVAYAVYIDENATVEYGGKRYTKAEFADAFGGESEIENEAAEARFEELLRKDGAAIDFAGTARYSIEYNNDGTPSTVVIEEDIFKGHENEKPHKVIKEYLKQNIGKFATIIESGQKVYFGKDLPGEYTQSRSTRQLSKYFRDAKNQAAQEMEELIEIASDRKWTSNTKSKHNISAKYGWYKYSTAFRINDVNYSADILIRNDADGKKYLYDIINIKRDTTRRGDKSPHQRSAYSSPDISETNVPVDTSISQNDKDVNTYGMQNFKKYSPESEDNNERRNLLSNGSGERQNGESAEITASVVDEGTGRAQKEKRDARERISLCDELKKSEKTERRIIAGHGCEVIPSEHYNDRMRAIEEKNNADGFDETIFITGGAEILSVRDENGKPKTARGVFIETADGRKIAIVRYDHTYFTPEQINEHEGVHKNYKTARVQKARNIIWNSLSVSERNKILNAVAEDYEGISTDKREYLIEEFVANTLAGMNEYSQRFAELVNDYQSGGEILDIYKAVDYNEIIDAGGYRITESGDAENAGRNNSRRTVGISERFGDKGRGNTSNSRNISTGDATMESSADGTIENRKRNESQRSGSQNMGESVYGSESKNASGRGNADGERFLEAVKAGNDELAKELLDKYAKERGYIPTTVYHGTHEAKAFTKFNNREAIWVTESEEYAADYVQNYTEASELERQLFTESNSGIFELYVKKGKVLDLGDINREIRNPQELIDFAQRIGFSKEEYIVKESDLMTPTRNEISYFE